MAHPKVSVPANSTQVVPASPGSINHRTAANVRPALGEESMALQRLSGRSGRGRLILTPPREDGRQASSSAQTERLPPVFRLTTRRNKDVQKRVEQIAAEIYGTQCAVRVFGLLVFRFGNYYDDCHGLLQQL
ncbi:MAG TPA: hypothetical protein VF527_12555 [Pyrinomonadaceae bacterium]|jgi:hypothetical protein